MLTLSTNDMIKLIFSTTSKVILFVLVAIIALLASCAASIVGFFTIGFKS